MSKDQSYLQIQVVEARNLIPPEKGGTINSFVTIVDPSQKRKTKVVKKSQDPVWKQSFTIGVEDSSKDLVLEVMDQKKLGHPIKLGEVHVALHDLSVCLRDNWYPIIMTSTAGGTATPELHITLQFFRSTPASEEQITQHGKASRDDSLMKRWTKSLHSRAHSKGGETEIDLDLGPTNTSDDADVVDLKMKGKVTRDESAGSSGTEAGGTGAVVAPASTSSSATSPLPTEDSTSGESKEKEVSAAEVKEVSTESVDTKDQNAAAAVEMKASDITSFGGTIGGSVALFPSGPTSSDSFKEKRRRHRTRLHKAVESGNIQEVKKVLSRKSSSTDMYAWDNDDQSPMVLAIRSGDVAVFEELLAYLRSHHLNINIEDSQQFTILHHAAAVGEKGILSLLLEVSGIDAGARNTDGNTPLHYFCQKYPGTDPSCRELFEKFLALGADVNAANRLGETPVHKATFNPCGSAEMISLLVKAGGVVNPVNKYGESPLHFAVRMSRYSAVRTLIQFAADYDVQEKKHKKTPYDTALEMKSRVDRRIPEYLMRVRELDLWLKDLNPDFFGLYRKTLVEQDLFLDVMPDVDRRTLMKLGVSAGHVQVLLSAAKKAQSSGTPPLTTNKVARSASLIRPSRPIPSRPASASMSSKVGWGLLECFMIVGPGDLLNQVEQVPENVHRIENIIFPSTILHLYSATGAFGPADSLSQPSFCSFVPMEEVDKSLVESLQQRLATREGDGSNRPTDNRDEDDHAEHAEGNGARYAIYALKCLVAVYAYPFHDFFRRWLRRLYSAHFEGSRSSKISLEASLFHLVHQVPLPVPGRSAVVTSLVSSKQRLFIPPINSLPLLHVPAYVLFRCLDLNNMLTLLKCVLLEKRIVVYSSQPVLLGFALEALVTLFFPFVWNHCYFSILPEIWSNLLLVHHKAPCLLGVNASCPSDLSPKLEKDLVLVYLDRNALTVSETLPEFPAQAQAKLISELSELLSPDLNALDRPNFTPRQLKSASAPLLQSKASISSFNVAAQLAFFKFWVSIFWSCKEYLMYLRVFERPAALFQKKKFLKSQPQSSQLFLNEVVETRCFLELLETLTGFEDTIFDDWIASSLFKCPLNEIVAEHLPYDSSYPDERIRPPSPVESPEGAEVKAKPFLSLNYALLKSFTPPPVRVPSTPLYHQAVPQQNASSQRLSPEPQQRDSSSGTLAQYSALVETICQDREPNQDSALLAMAGFAEIDKRITFGKLLLRCIKSSQSDPSFESMKVGKLSDKVFGLVGDLLSEAFRAAHHQEDFESPAILLEAGGMFYRKSGEQESMLSRLKKEEIWQNELFWEKSFFTILEAETLNLYKYQLRDKIRLWKQLKGEEERKKIVSHELEMISNLLSSFAYRMTNLDLDAEMIRRFVGKMCEGLRLGDEASTRVKTLIYHMCKLHENTESSVDRRMSKEYANKLSFRRDHVDYLPIGIISDMPIEQWSLYHLVAGSGYAKPWMRSSSEDTVQSALLRPHYRMAGPSGFHGRGNFVVKLLEGHQKEVLCLSTVSPSCLASGSADASIKLWDSVGGSCSGTLSGHSGSVNCLASDVASGGIRLISGSVDRTCKLWDTTKLQKIRSFRGHSGPISCIVLTPRYFLSGSYDHLVHMWDHRSKKSVMSFSGHSGAVLCMDTTGNYLITGSRDTTVRVWDVRIAKEMACLCGHSDWVRCLKCTGENNSLLSGSHEGIVKMWDLNSSACLRTFVGHTGRINDILVDVSSKFIASASSDATIGIWPVDGSSATVELSTRLTGHIDEVISLVPFLDRYIASASYDGTIAVWDVDNGSRLQSLTGHRNRITSLGSGVPGQLVSAGWDSTVRIWEFGLDFR